MHFYQLRHVAEVGDYGHLQAISAKREADRIGGIVGNRERVNVNIANREVLASVNRFDATETLFKAVGKNSFQGVKCGLGDVERRFPQAKHLRKSVAMIGVLVGDQDSVKLIEGDFG